MIFVIVSGVWWFVGGVCGLMFIIVVMCLVYVIVVEDLVCYICIFMVNVYCGSVYWNFVDFNNLSWGSGECLIIFLDSCIVDLVVDFVCVVVIGVVLDDLVDCLFDLGIGYFWFCGVGVDVVF